MNKKLITLAVAAALAAPLVAQAGVTVYGRAQVELSNMKTDGMTNASKNTTTRSLNDNNKMSRIGVNATEDLGNGMTGIAHYGFIANLNPSATSSSGISASRQAYVGLQGGFGRVQFGTNAGAYKDTNLDPFIATSLEARSYGGESRGAYGTSGFINDSIKYTNKFGLVKFTALVTAGNSTKGDNGDYQLAVDYNGGPLRVIVAYSHHKVNKDTKVYRTSLSLVPVIVPAYTEKRIKLAGQYAMGPGKITLSYERVTNYARSNLGGNPGTAGVQMLGKGILIKNAVLATSFAPKSPAKYNSNANTVGDVNFTMLGYTMKLPNHNNLWLRYGREDYKDYNGVVNSYAAAITHMMSKTFRVWAGYDESKFDGGSKFSTLSVGMRKDF